MWEKIKAFDKEFPGKTIAYVILTICALVFVWVVAHSLSDRTTHQQLAVCSRAGCFRE